MDKIALVTNAQRSDNLARARALARQGLHVVVAAPEWSKAVDAALQLQLEGLSAEALHLQHDDAHGLESAKRQIVGLHGRLDVVVDDEAAASAS